MSDSEETVLEGIFLMPLDPFNHAPSTALSDFLCQEEERRRRIPDYVWNAKLDQVTRMSELLESTRVDMYSLASSSFWAMMEQHSKALLQFTNTINQAELSTSFLAAQSVLASIKEETDRRAALIGLSLTESVRFADLGTRVDAVNVFKAASIATFLPSHTELLSTIAALQPVWPSASIGFDSIQGMTGLMSLRNALGGDPFDASATKAIQGLIGTWDSAKLTESISGDAVARKQFYLDQGFDPRLTAFPSSLYDGTLFQSGLLLPDLFSPVFPKSGMGYFPSEENDEESNDTDSDESHAVKARLLRTYDMISNLEMQLREFLMEVMESVVGKDWIKQRVPGETYKEWKAKRDDAVRKGEEEQPIISYADFTDYERIISRKDNWNDVFEETFTNLSDIQVSFQRLYPIRNCTMHTRPITQEDFLLLTVEIRRISRAIGLIDR